MLFALGNFAIMDLLQLACYFVMIYGSVLFLLVYIGNLGKFKQKKAPKKLPSVTILIPAYNEEKGICKCLKTCLNLDYPKNLLKIIVINDGSKDNTLKECRKIKNPRIRVISKKNTGKADSLNYALRFVKTDYIATMDADSFPKKDYLRRIVGELGGDIVAVSPAMKISKSRTLMQKIQWVEYIFSIYLRKLFAVLDCQYVLPGPGSVYKTELIRKMGGWDKDSIVEDMELAFRMQLEGRRMENSTTAVVYTEAPETFRELFNQRIRWYRGYFKTTAKYLRMFGNPRYGNLGVYVLPINFVWLFILGYMLFLPAYLSLKSAYDTVHAIMLVGLQTPTLSFVFDIISINSLSYFMLLFMSIGISIILISIHASNENLNLRKRKLDYLSYMFIYPLLYSIFWMGAIVYELLKLEKKW
ncbi:MAG: glycosyltransferase family 2 protein [Candidatus Aenigmarchaeota archaeon]|nr:glycosyltransferase family 2 protein [Candidatus Aenigmarchaeota archaeon]